MILAAIVFGIFWLSWRITLALGPHPYIAVFAPEHLQSVIDADKADN